MKLFTEKYRLSTCIWAEI